MGGSQHLVGRDQTLDRLRVTFEQALAGRGGVVLVAGEPGIGKTAVLSALADEAADRSAVVTWGQCWDDSMAPAFWPWTQVLRELDHPLAPAGGQLLTIAERAESDATVDRFDAFDAVRTVLGDVSESRGLLVVLDDLQWADEATMALLSFLARHAQRTRVLIVGAFRDVDMPTRLVRLTGMVEVVTLEALSEHDATDLARAVAGGRLPPDAVDQVARRAAGNPLFVQELTRLVTTAQGSLGEPGLHLAGGIREVVTQRLSGLSPACRAMLDIAALLGSDVRVDVLVRSLGGRDDLPELVAEAIRARILTSPDADQPSLAFVHDLFREVLSALLAPAVGAQLHLTLARTLAELQADGAAIPHAMVAAHYLNAASRGMRPAVVPAVDHSQHAAAEAARQLAFADAAAHLRRALAALQLADRPDPRKRFEVLLSLGFALDQSGDATAAHDVLIEATDLARRLGDHDGFAHAAIGIHRLGALSGLARDHTMRLLEESVSTLDRASPLRARTLASLARELHHTWDPAVDQQARAVAADAVAIARQLDDPATLAFCLLALHDTTWSVGSAPERLPIVTEMLDIARQADDRELLAQGQLLKATALLELGDPSSIPELERYCRLAEDLGHARGRWGALSRRAVASLLAGELDRAAELGRVAAELGEEIGEPDTPGVRDTLLWEIGRFRSGWSNLVPEGHWVPPGSWPPVRAVLLIARGDRDTAAAVLAGYSLEQDHRHGIRRHDGWMPMVITEAVVQVGNDAQRTEVYEWLATFAGHHLVYGGCMGYGGAVDHHLATLAGALGRHAAAADHLRAALSMHETLGALAWAALDRAMLTAADAVPPALPHRPVTETHGEFRREGDAWRVTYRGRSSTVRHVKGMLDLAVLLARPGREVPALELMGGVDVGGAPGPILDEQARRAYQRHVGQLQAEIDDAKAANDWMRADRAEAELDAVVEQLSDAFGLGGRPRAGGGAAERARAAVTHRIRGAIRRIADVDAVLGQHLGNAVKTGTWCAYQPETGTEWYVLTDSLR